MAEDAGDEPASEGPDADTERRVRSLEAELDHLRSAVDEVILTVDAWGTIDRANPALATVLGVDPDEVVGEPIDAVLAGEDDLEDGDGYVPSEAVAAGLVAEDPFDRPP